ncbi:uncharacterized protein PAC_15019 [Phialocephala subalpina]|uniref:Uncharacterized protein n=1 Tax=Phialocephala subalpina TaxID=576137 RepID=A0A1L7XJA7_9HELO|nr:uncharacterized protein PAC_15019 [Phialocephala subalpina]
MRASSTARDHNFATYEGASTSTTTSTKREQNYKITPNTLSLSDEEEENEQGESHNVGKWSERGDGEDQDGDVPEEDDVQGDGQGEHDEQHDGEVSGAGERSENGQQFSATDFFGALEALRRDSDDYVARPQRHPSCVIFIADPDDEGMTDEQIQRIINRLLGSLSS